MRFLMLELFTKSNIFIYGKILNGYMERMNQNILLHKVCSKPFGPSNPGCDQQVNKSGLLLAIGNPTSPIHSAAIATWCDITDNSELVLEHHINIKLFSTLWPRLLQLLVPKRWCSHW
jgi:hypothetical protein